MGSIGWTEILVVALIAVILFGGRRLADAGRGLGEAIRNFREGMKGDSDGGKSGPGNDTNRRGDDR
ncbi:MAG TPA: twin-arginine translocase TatA/TatE family subunit [Candidatus Polarisedimenticolaceae bacterium]|nr:twin-arginine translocase TatA/TatE family subunit [Candidatus Polarisedimenticolaceae bacterium]